MTIPPLDDIDEKELEELFCQVAITVGREPSSQTSSTSDDEKLRLYGLYKRATEKEYADSSNPPSLLRPVARSKFFARQACMSMSKESAMQEYIRIVMSRHDDLGDKCRSLYHQHHAMTSNDFSNLTNSSDVNQSKSLSRSLIALDRKLPRNSDSEVHCSMLENDCPSFASNVPLPVDTVNRNPSDNTAKIDQTLPPIERITKEFIGVDPLVPRGRLDLSYGDLGFALRKCLFQKESRKEYDRLDSEIQEMWAPAVDKSSSTNDGRKSSASKVIVGLSVRSLFDLYLTMKGYPDGSEILVVPPISVPGMMLVARYHNLCVVPVDIDFSKNDDCEDGRKYQWVNLQDVNSKISKKAVAILVVHPFGIITTKPSTMEAIRTIANKHHLEIWEDCAETFTGLGAETYLGSSAHADVRFFSFGTIKTATALGGGVALIRNGNDANHMSRLQQCFYIRQQNRGEYFRKVILAALLNFIADSPLRVGILSWFCKSCGFNFDDLVTKSVRGFHLPGTKTNDRSTERCLVRQIRKRPSNALLAVLRRRLQQSQIIAPSVHARMKRCKRVLTLLESEIPRVLFPKADHLVQTFWAFPICCPNRNIVSEKIRNEGGFDVATGASQLCSISQYTNGTNRSEGQTNATCPNTDSLMSSILYLPVCSQHLSDSLLVDLVNTINITMREACESANNPPGVPSTRMERTMRNCAATFSVPTRLIMLVVIMSVWSGWSVSSRQIGRIIWWLLYACALRLTGEFMLRWMTAEFYLKESTAFAENCDMIDAQFDEVDGRTKNAMSRKSGNDAENGIMNQMKSLQLPSGIDDTNQVKKIIVTGATGFVGSALLHDLLIHRKSLSLQKIIVLCRRKRNMSPSARISRLLKKPIFHFLSETEKKSLIQVVEGDVTMHHAGIAPMDLAEIVQDEQITHVFHSAAAVSFTLEFQDAAESNITSSLNMQCLTGLLKNKNARFVHVSTAFVHGDNVGSKNAPLPEALFDFKDFDPKEIYRSMIGTQYYASRAMADFNFPNTYAFSKSVCEHLLSDNLNVDTLIIRPSIVGPALETPFEGWAGDRPSTIVAGPCLHLSHQWNIWHLGREAATCFPVDLLARFILVKAFSEDSQSLTGIPNDGTSSTDGSFERIGASSDEFSDEEDIRSGVLFKDAVECRIPRIYNATWDSESRERASFSWLEFSVAYLHLGSVLGYFSRSCAMIQLLISAQLIPRLKPTNPSFAAMQSFLVRSPFEYAQRCFDFFGLTNVDLTKILAFLDLPKLFYPFVKSEFYFQSCLTVPQNFDRRRYGFSCGVAAHRFILSKRRDNGAITKGEDKLQRMCSFAIGGRYHKQSHSYFWWALCQPRGTIFFRLVAAFVGCVLREISSIVTVDLISFRAHLDRVRSKSKAGPVYLVLAPTHRSFLDFILLSYVFFSLPELQIKLPFIIAADEFQHLPLIGWLARQLKAFYIKRGKGRVDTSLTTKLTSLKSQNENATFEVFIEGKRSRDRRFVDPKTGLLKSLNNSGGGHVILPITINYEAIPEQNILSDEAGGSTRRELSLSGMLFWLKDVMKGNVNIGKIHIVASAPMPLDCDNDSDFRTLVDQIQAKQQEEILVSDYHLHAAAKLLNMNNSVLRSILRDLGGRFWPDVGVEGIPEIPLNESNLLSVMLHFAHLLAPLIPDRRKQWSTWLNRVTPFNTRKFNISNKDIQLLRKKLESLFDAAEGRVYESINILKAKGFSNPDCDHILQAAEAIGQLNIPRPVLLASVLMRSKRKRDYSYSTLSLQGTIGSVTSANHLTDSEEKLGFWGYRDSGFIAKVDGRGRRFVTMKGNRYALAGKRMYKLLPFIESALKLRIDLSKEFTSIHPKWYRSDVETELRAEDQKLLRSMLSGRVSLSTMDRLRHGTGHSQEDVFAIRHGENIRIPDVVLWPSSESEVRAIVEAAQVRGWCLIPHGGGTNVTESTRCPPKETDPRPMVTVSTKTMNRILWLNEEDGLAHVEAGITGQDLVEALHRRGYTMGHEPDSIEFSTLGGWIATKASGMKRSKYGNIEDIVLSTRIVSPSGKMLWKSDGRDMKTVSGRNSEGIDLSTLSFGSEGCLGIIVSAIIRVRPLPELKTFDSVLFSKFEDGLRFVRSLARNPQQMPASVRLLDNAHFRLGQALGPEDPSLLDRAKNMFTKSIVSITHNFDPDSVVCAVIGYEGTQSSVHDERKFVSSVASTNGGILLGSKIGRAGYELTYMIAYLRDFALTYHVLGESFETFCPWSRIEALISATKERIIVEHTKRLLPGRPFVGCRVTQLYHEGVCLYFYLCIGFEGIGNDRASIVYSELERAARDEILKQGGSLSHHHGLGKVRACFAKQRSSVEFQDVLATIKETIDENNIFGVRNGLFAS